MTSRLTTTPDRIDRLKRLLDVSRRRAATTAMASAKTAQAATQ
jgi:hypothetical protein